MDHFGISAGLLGAAEIYFRSGRRTGRTTSLIESLKNGDRVACASVAEQRRLLQLCSQRGITVEIVHLDPARPWEIFDRGPSAGRTLFDHSWVEQVFRNAIEQCAKDIDHLQRESSGFGTPHLETRRCAEEMMRWR